MATALYSATDAFSGFSSIEGRGFETRLPPHVHAWYVLGLVEAGTLRVTTNGRSFIARPGSIVALTPFQVHTELPLGEGGWSFRYLYPSETTVRLALGLASGSAEHPALTFVRPVLEDARLAWEIRRTHEMIRSGCRSTEVEDALGSVLRRAREGHARPPCDEPAARAGVARVTSLLTAGPLRGVTLPELARVAGLSTFRFVRVFHTEVGLPPYAFYETVRIAFAHDLIQQGQDLSTIAYGLGFADQSHLTRQFRRASFTTPGRLAGMVRQARLGRPGS
jgi:AraC-like DNA-binding protein